MLMPLPSFFRAGDNQPVRHCICIEEKSSKTVTINRCRTKEKMKIILGSGVDAQSMCLPWFFSKKDIN